MSDCSKNSKKLIPEPHNMQEKYNTEETSSLNYQSESKAADNELQRNEEKFRWLIKLSNDFTSIQLNTAEQVISDSLADLGKFVGADRAYIFSYDHENRVINNTHEWCSEGITPQVQNHQNLLLNDFEFWVQSHISGTVIQISNVSEYPDEKTRHILELQSIKSLLSIPLMNRNRKCLGLVGFDSVTKPMIYTATDQQMLQVYANLLVSIIERIENENDLFTAKEKAEKNEEKFRLMIKNSNDSFVLINRQAEQFYISDAAIRDTGFSIEELKGPIDNVIYPDDLDIVHKAWNDVLNIKNDMIRVQYRHKHKYKNYIWYEAVCQNHLDNPAINAVVVNVRDITAIKEQEIELRKSKERAEISDRLKSAFLANMSHEIRTPMNGILGFAELLREPDLAGEQQQEFIEIIEKSGLRMLNIINDIIDISKIEAGLMKVNMSELSINKLADYIFAFFSPEAKAKGLEISIENQLPNGEDIVLTDHEKLYAILANLVKNAVKFTDSGYIRIGFEKKEHNFEFYVKDTGIGIPGNRQHSIFERFVQATADNHLVLQGAGLGLAISKAYVEILDGRIWIESEEGVGSTFFFTIPCRVKQNTEIGNIYSTKGSISMKDKLKILLAEDDQISEKLLELMIKSISKEIIKTSSGIEVVEICRNNPDIDLILMDMQMPEKDGFEAAREIREFNSNVIIIAQTAFGLEGDKEKAIKAGCNDYISKPIKKEDLLKMIPKYFREKN